MQKAAPASLWQLRGNESDQARSIAAAGPFHHDQEAWTPQRPPVAPLSGLQAGASRHSQSTPRSQLGYLGQPELRVSWPSLEIDRADVEALNWWFSEVESHLASALPDARCPFPWLQGVDGAQVDEVLEELSDSFTFKDFRKGWNHADYSEFPKWHEERMRRLCATTQAEAQPLAPLGLGGRTPRRSQSHPTVSLPPWRDRREGRCRNSAPVLGFISDRTASLTPRLQPTDEMSVGDVAPGNLRLLAREPSDWKPRGLRQCHSAR